MNALKFKIRDILLVTAIVGISVAWWMDHRRMAAITSEARSQERRWQFRAVFLQDQINGTKIGGEWLWPHRMEFDPHSEAVYSARRKSGGKSIAAGKSVSWRKEWSNLH